MPFLTRILKWDLRATIAFSAVILVMVGWSLAANNENIVSLDFGDGQSIKSGSISVPGSMYPTSALGLEMGWLNPVIIKSDGGAVSDPLLKDSNVGIDASTFKISGLTRTIYNAEIISGNLSSTTATKVTYAGQNYLIRSNPGEWNRVNFSITPVDGTVEIGFSRLGTAETLWAVNGMVLTATDTALPKSVFDVTVQPVSHLVYTGGQAVYRIGISSASSYASDIYISLVDLAPTITAQITPSQGLAPFAADLRLITTAATPPTVYTFTVQVQGTDAEMFTVNKEISLTVTNSKTEALPDLNADNPDFLNSAIDQLDNLLPVTMREMLSSQDRIDLLKRLQEQRLANLKQLRDLQDLSFSGVAPTMPELPDPEDNVGAALLYLTKAGIIGTVVDYAPPAEAGEQPTGFWGKFFGSVSNPVR